MWNIGIKPEAFRLTGGEEHLSVYGRAGDWGETHHRFCKQCGIATHGHGRIDGMGGPYVSVHLAALDDLPVEDLIAAPVSYMDGLRDNWWNAPAETRQL